ncbi:hypothetical protein ACH5RR_026803 [Cinchona calisaya]|uniref:SHSP domain-containing protein n=1 Tax=Cinchona calisaya TaxID=153742 RepID=A0ABD2Z3N1_9GENT
MSVFPLHSILFNPLLSDNNTTNFCSMDWKETPEAHIFKFDLPGLTQEDIKLQIHDDQLLHISEAADSKKDLDDDFDQKGECKWHCKERISARRNFQRDFRLPENALIDQISASMCDGVLVVTVPKNDKLRKKTFKRKTVEISRVDGKNEDASPPKGFGRFVCCKA